MHPAAEKISLFFVIIRAYSLPISAVSWFVAFLYSVLRGGSFIYGIIALFGIIFLHAATNLFDDITDYIREKADIDNGLKNKFNFQESKCRYLINGTHTLKQYIVLLIGLMIIPAVSAVFFIYIFGTKLLFIIVPTLILCILYPILGCLGLGELLVALIFSPLLYTGVNFVMTGHYSTDILLLSVSTGLLSVAVLHNHMLLDFNYDEQNRKITLCRLCITKENALLLLELIIAGAFANILLLVVFKGLSLYYLSVFLCLPSAIELIKVMKIHIKDPNKEIPYNIFMGNVGELKKVPESERGFLLKFLIVRNLLNFFTIFLCGAMILECIL